MNKKEEQTEEENLERIIQKAISILTSRSEVLKTEAQSEVLTVRQAADFLHLSQSTIYTYISKRSIPFCKRNGSVWLLRSRLLEWIKEGEKQTFHQLSK